MMPNGSKRNFTKGLQNLDNCNDVDSVVKPGQSVMFFTKETKQEKDLTLVSPVLLSFDFSTSAWRQNVPSVSLLDIKISV